MPQCNHRRGLTAVIGSYKQCCLGGKIYPDRFQLTKILDFNEFDVHRPILRVELTFRIEDMHRYATSKRGQRSMSGPGGFGLLSFAGLGAGLLSRFTVCSCSHCSRTVFLTDSRLLSGMGCFFAQPKRTRCPSYLQGGLRRLCFCLAWSGNERLGFFQAAPDFHSHVFVIQVLFLAISP